MKKIFFLFIVISCTLYSCVKEPGYPNYPIIKFVSVSSSLIASGSTDTITFSFTDGNGQIGMNTSTTDTSSNPSCCGDAAAACLKLSNFNIFLTDNRGSQCVYPFQSPNLVPTGNYKGIKGNLQVLQAVYNLQGCPLDSVTYTIVMKDLQGNFSNKIQTTPIYITCQ